MSSWLIKEVYGKIVRVVHIMEDGTRLDLDEKIEEFMQPKMDANVKQVHFILVAGILSVHLLCASRSAVRTRLSARLRSSLRDKRSPN